MRKVTLLFVLLLSIPLLNAQELLSFSTVIQAEGKSKTEIYGSVRAWFALSMKDANKVLVMDDKDSGTLVGNTNVNYSYGKFSYSAYDGWIDFTIQINIKDDRFKVEIKNISHKKSNREAFVPDMGLLTTSEECPHGKGLNKKSHQKVWDDIKSKVGVLSELIFTQIESSLNSTQKNDSDDNW